jgi:GTP-binding protein
VKFVDEVTLTVASGKGGPGCVSFRRESKAPRGGPDGGDGGRGGHLIFKTSTRVHSLLDFKQRASYRAPDGERGYTQNCAGKDAEDLVLIVPPGTMIKDTDGNIIKDLGPNEEFLFLEGGLGGLGNTFYKSSVNQAPTVAQKGMTGIERVVKLELKLLADIGIIGFPNAGKSTLISHISAAKPKVADYPFTTLVPNLGVVKYGEESNFVVADMPGLIKGAHKGLGLGTRFLKHIERTKCFVHVVDVSGMSGRDFLDDFKDINQELKLYDKAHKKEMDFEPLSKRKQIVALNKIDTLDEKTLRKVIRKFEKVKYQVVPISAVAGTRLDKLVMLMGEMVFDGENEA